MKLRTFLLWLGAIRFVLALVAIPLAPFLYEEHFVVLILLRPTKEVLLAAGFLVHEGLVGFAPVVLASIPLALLGVWLFFALGDMYEKEMRSGDLPWLAGKLLTPKRVKRVAKALDKKGPRLILLGRGAVLSSAGVATAAGASKIETRQFLWYDGLGAVVSLGLSFVAGWFLEETYDQAGPVITVAGTAILVAFAFVLGRQLLKA